MKILSFSDRNFEKNIGETEEEKRDGSLVIINWNNSQLNIESTKEEEKEVMELEQLNCVVFSVTIFDQIYCLSDHCCCLTS